MNTETIRVDRQPPVALLRLHRPASSNSISMKMLEDLIAALASLDADGNVRVIVLCGAGKNFCAGLDFTTFDSIAERLDQKDACPGRIRRELMTTIEAMQVSTRNDAPSTIRPCPPKE
jgi:enoyl-CoA hydratase/carnithine racemase